MKVTLLIIHIRKHIMEDIKNSVFSGADRIQFIDDEEDVRMESSTW